jgi:uncharacterized protein YjbI with pentapeptide repeats
VANDDHTFQLRRGVASWNAWRVGVEVPDLIEASLVEADLGGANLIKAILSGANLSGADLSEANLIKANLSGASLRAADLREAALINVNLREADLSGANLRGADLSEANLINVNLREADLSGANLHGAYLREAILGEANLSEADLGGTNFRGANLCEARLIRANLQAATLVETDLTGADLTGCRIYGVSAWRVKLDGAKQQNLIVTPSDEPEIAVDSIEVAQFIYLLLHNEKIRDVIDTITSKAVLILGRFTEDRKAVLDAMRDELRQRGYLPILFDFEGPLSRNRDETITLLARLARFVIADISDAKSVLQELRAIVPDLPTLPVQPVIVAAQEEPGMFDFYHCYDWFLKVHRYDNQKQLIADLGERVILPAETKVQELRRVQRQGI